MNKIANFAQQGAFRTKIRFLDSANQATWTEQQTPAILGALGRRVLYFVHAAQRIVLACQHLARQADGFTNSSWANNTIKSSNGPAARLTTNVAKSKSRLPKAPKAANKPTLTALRTTSSPTWWLPRFKRAALLGSVLCLTVAVSFVDATAANADPATASPGSTTVTGSTDKAPSAANAADSDSSAADAANAAATTDLADSAPSAANAANPAPPASATDSAEQTAGNGVKAGVDNFSLHHLRWDYKEADFFKRISEYFSGRESTGYRLILRTDPQERAGLYFQASLSAPISELPTGSTLVVRYVRSDKAEATVTHTFELPDTVKNSNKTQLWLGFTGADTPADKAPPTAWQVSVVDAAGKQLAEVHSFLWSPRNARAN